MITGRKVFAYTVDAEGKEIPIGEMSMRTKGGTTLQTTYTFANDLKKCLEKIWMWQLPWAVALGWLL